jgi:hypothetical protein
MRRLAALCGLTFACFSSAQTYSSLFDIPEAGTQFRSVTVDGGRNIFLAGVENGQIIARRLTENGAEVWTTALPNTSDAAIGEIILDAENNIYLSARIGEPGARQLFIASFNRADGTVRWTKRDSTMDDNALVGIAAARVGSSVLLYAVSTIRVSGSNTDLLALRLNPNTGADVWRRQINLGGGVTLDTGLKVAVNSSGAPFFLARRDTAPIQTSIFRLSGTDGSNVFRRDLAGVGVGPGSMQVLTTNNNIGISAANFSSDAPTTVALLSGVNGSIIASEDVASFDKGGRSTKFGAYLSPRAPGQGGFLLRMDGTTGRFAQQTIADSVDRVLAIDNADQLHVSVLAVGGNKIVRMPAGGSISTDLAIIGATVDNKNNLIVVGVSNGVGRVAKFAQEMKVNSDTFNASFGTVLSVAAPGVLANDFAPGALLEVTTPPTAGSVTLSQNGAFVYTPAGSQVTTDTFGYRATINGISQTASVVIRRTVFEALTSFKSTVIGSEPVLAFARFSQPPSFSGTITVSANNSLVTPPSALSINTLDELTSIRMRTAVTASALAVVVSARAFNTTRTLNVVLRPGGVNSITLGGSGPMTAGQTAVGRVDLTGPAPSGGQKVQLQKIQGNATLPQEITIASGQTFGLFTINAPQSTVGTTLQVRAIAFEGVREAFRTILPMPGVATVETSSFVVGGVDLDATVFLDKVTPYNLPINVDLLANTANAIPPDLVLVPVNKDRVAFKVKTVAVTSARAFRLRVEAGGGLFERNITVIPNPLDRVTLNPATVSGGANSEGTVHLNNLAQGDGQLVQLASGNTALATVPSSVKVITGSWSSVFQVVSKPVTVPRVVSINARIGGVQRSATLTITP